VINQVDHNEIQYMTYFYKILIRRLVKHNKKVNNNNNLVERSNTYLCVYLSSFFFCF
jgi:hypothetical protein